MTSFVFLGKLNYSDCFSKFNSTLIGRTYDIQTDLLWPVGIAIDSDENYFISDHRHNRIQIVDINNRIDSIFSENNHPITIKEPWGIVHGLDGRVFITERPGMIHIYNRDGNRLSSLLDLGSPYGLSIDSNQRLIISCLKTVRIFDQSGQLIKNLTNTKITEVASVACPLNGNLLLGNQSDPKILVFDSGFDFLFEIGSRGSKDGEFRDWMQLTTDHYDRIVVADMNNSRLQFFDSDGTHLGCFGSKGKGIGQFDYPRAIQIDRFGRIVVSDSGENNRIQIIEPSLIA